jgi:hypothetical protein
VSFPSMAIGNKEEKTPGHDLGRDERPSYESRPLAETCRALLVPLPSLRSKVIEER